MGKFRKDFPLSWLINTSTLLDLELDSIKAFIEESTKMIDEREKKLSEEYEKLEKDIKDNPQKYYDPEEGLGTAYDYFEYDFMNLSEFSPILYNSIFTSLYSKLEITIFQICNLCQSYSNLKIGVKDISESNGILKGKKYLEKVIEINFDRMSGSWKGIQYYQSIRNNIVHANGNRKVEERNLLKFISNQRGIVYDEDKQKVIIQTKYFLLDFCAYFEKLIIDIVRQIVEQKNDSTDQPSDTS